MAASIRDEIDDIVTEFNRLSMGTFTSAQQFPMSRGATSHVFEKDYMLSRLTEDRDNA
eukprot:CAMPEP_0170564082 /NCGR_PEP_ID=MMETSP0211-20121228/70813_1 /TAXON_ID=311385 /ORGANISM="Pseudokeronopsis sp., Strain OXSARD2" /LENGTH=57 /DNA_ID=CAMNT_0010883101 /DNA_START=164 /DNA_END=337 /DNA_ORIENTATION=+